MMQLFPMMFLFLFVTDWRYLGPSESVNLYCSQESCPSTIGDVDAGNGDVDVPLGGGR